MMNPTTEMVKTMCRAIHVSAQDVADSDAGGDHITTIANYTAADAMRRVADAIGYALIGTEDFRSEEEVEALPKG